MPASFAGRRFYGVLLDSLPAGIDPCGENGRVSILRDRGLDARACDPIAVGDTVERDGFAFADLMPDGKSAIA
jgi:hypothetical protein